MSLIELMVSLTIGLFLVGAVALIYLNTANSSKLSGLEAEMNENASVALEVLRHQISITGYSDLLPTTNKPVFTGLAIRGCDGGFGTDADSLNDAEKEFDATDLVCSTKSTSATDSDAIAIRYQATLLNSQTVKGTTTPPVPDRPANCNYEGITKDSMLNATFVSLAYDRYYIDTDTDGNKALFCKGKTGNDTFGTATALIPNIEDMQLRYALTLAPVVDTVTPHQITGYVDASNDKLYSSTTPSDLVGWERVAGVEICLVARSNQKMPGWNNTTQNDFGSYRGCDNTEITNADGYMRRSYRTTVFLRNLRPGVPTAYAADTDPWAQQSKAVSP